MVSDFMVVLFLARRGNNQHQTNFIGNSRCDAFIKRNYTVVQLVVRLSATVTSVLQCLWGFFQFGQPTNTPTNQSTNQPTKQQQTNKQTNKQTNQSTNQSINQSNNRSTNQPANQPAVSLGDQQNNQPNK
jgi:hypothetical protein